MKRRQLVVWSLVVLLLLWPGLSWAQQPKPGGTLRIALPGDPAFYNQWSAKKLEFGILTYESVS
jgi:hypothetical protein